MQRIIGGIARHRALKKINSGFAIRPTSDKVREALFDIMAYCVNGSSVLDLFSGTGAVGLEALSRGAEHCIFIENNINHYRLIKENISLLGFSGGEVYLKDCLMALKILYQKQAKFDIIFIDPPYFHKYGEESLLAISNYDLLNKDGVAVWEHERREKAEDKIGKLKLKKHNVYGNISLSFYKMDNETADRYSSEYTPEPCCEHEF